MSSLSGLSRAISGLRASESALQTTAHNLTNVNTPGYVRQQVLFKDSKYLHIGSSATSRMSVGLGVDVSSIRQVRDIFLDKAYRDEGGRMGFYSAQYGAVSEIETMFGEMEGESFSKILDDLWVSLGELSKHPDGLETRASFTQNAVLFVEKANLISDQLSMYQLNLNTEIRDKVNRINTIGSEVSRLNNEIIKYEVSGGHANDYRDQRNLLMDELSAYANVSYKEDLQGNVLVSLENVPFVVIGGYNKLGLASSEPKSLLMQPYWPHLSSPTFNQPLFNLENPTGPQFDNDKGELKGMLMARGTRRADYTDLANLATYEAEIKDSVIMRTQAQFDQLVHGIVTMINNIVAPNTVPPGPRQLDTANAPYGLDGTQGTEIFVRKNMSRYDGLGNYNEEDPANWYSLYSAGNIEVNRTVLADYNKINLSVNPLVDGDNSVVAEMLRQWQTEFAVLEPGTTGALNFRNYYNGLIGNLGNFGNIAKSQMTNQRLMVTQIDNQRSRITGVSSDEELGNMLKYQHAYNAAARVVTTVDSMIEKIVTSLGIVGR